MESRRKVARHLFNGDCNFFFYNPELWQPEGGKYTAAAIHRYVRRLARCGIDTLLANPNTQVAWYPSKEIPYVLNGYRRGDRAFVRGIASGNINLSGPQLERYIENMVALFDRYLDLQDAGVDWLAECAAACRKEKINAWLSYRMNATHFSGAPESSVNASLFRDPRNRLSVGPDPELVERTSGLARGCGVRLNRSRGLTPILRNATEGGQGQAAQRIRSERDHTWLGLNYGRREVRDYMRAMIRDGLQGYDFDGVELDWLRNPLCLEPGSTAKDRAMMTEWIAEIRELGAARRHFTLGLRVPGNLPYLKTIGLDVKAMVRRGLLDYITFSNYWQTPWTLPLDELRRELGGNVRLFGGIEGAPNWLGAGAPGLRRKPLDQEVQLAGDAAAEPKGPSVQAVEGTRYLAASPQFLRGAAASRLALGADGIEHFNFYVADQVRVAGQRARYNALRGLETLAALRGREKHYAFNTAAGHSHEIWDGPMELPASIAKFASRKFRLPMCAESGNPRLQLIVQLIVRRSATPGPITVRFNRRLPVSGPIRTSSLLFPAGPYRRQSQENQAYNFTFPILPRDGWNEIQVRNGGDEPLVVIGIEVGICRGAPRVRPIKP